MSNEKSPGFLRLRDKVIQKKENSRYLRDVMEKAICTNEERRSRGINSN